MQTEKECIQFCLIFLLKNLQMDRCVVSVSVYAIAVVVTAADFFFSLFWSELASADIMLRLLLFPFLCIYVSLRSFFIYENNDCFGFDLCLLNAYYVYVVKIYSMKEARKSHNCICLATSMQQRQSGMDYLRFFLVSSGLWRVDFLLLFDVFFKTFISFFNVHIGDKLRCTVESTLLSLACCIVSCIIYQCKTY